MFDSLLFGRNKLDCKTDTLLAAPSPFIVGCQGTRAVFGHMERCCTQAVRSPDAAAAYSFLRNVRIQSLT